MALLELTDFSLKFPETGFNAVNSISFEINPGEVLALVGESGSGKTLTALSILGLQPLSAELSGTINFQGVNLLSSKHYPKGIRGKKISLIPQDPLSALNPMYSIFDQLKEAVQVYQPKLSEKQIYELCLNYLEKVGIPDPVRTLKAYPHEISGGMRQRVMIAMAIINEPELLIADEPTTALDVTVQAVILKLLKSLNQTILFITHDLGVVAEIADRVLVMRRGEIVERASVYDIFAKPSQDYTKELLESIPRI